MATKAKKTSKFMNNPFDFILCIVVFILLALGIVMVLSASAPSALAEGGESYEYAGKQLLFAILGLAAMFFISKIDYRFYKKFYWAIYGVSVGILLLVLIPGIKVTAGGATRWVAIPGLGQFQPSEFTKIGLIIFFAGYLSDHKNEMKDFWKGFVRPFVFIVPPIAILYFVQNHLSASLIIAMITCVMMIIAGARMLHFIGAGLIGGVGIGAYLFYKITSSTGGSDSFRITRIISFLDPWADATDTGWQVVQSLYAIGSGGLFGTGLGGSKQKYLYISEPQNDFIFSIVAEELGFIGCAIIIALFAIFIWRGILIAMKAPDTFGGLLATGITSLVAIQVIMNIAVVTSSMPNTGIPLPFFSYGGTALLILLSSVRYIIEYFASGAERLIFRKEIKNMKVIIAAAGTGGHINPGIAIANKIKEKEPDSEIIFIGTNRGLENDLVPRAGYELKTIQAYGFNRKISLDNFKKMYKTFRSIGEAKKIIQEFQPDIVIGTGGYICVPVGMAAKKAQVPIVLHESNAFPGIAIKMLSKKAETILLGFEDAKSRIPNAKKIVVTGTPTKVKHLEISESQKAQIIHQLGLQENLPVVLCFGGSQGAQSINDSLIRIIKKHKNVNYQLVWAAGPAQYEEVKESLKECNMEIEHLDKVKIVPYIYNMEEIMNAVDLVVCRSGAMTITEVSNVGKPAIFIPFPFATENHQEYNARVLEKVDAAKIILDKNLTVDLLNDMIENLVKDREKLRKMGENAISVSIQNVEEKIYQEIITVVKKDK